jgi:hypothetical protein
LIRGEALLLLFIAIPDIRNRGIGTGLSHTMYRFHIQGPIYFQKSLRAAIEHGHANDREDDYTSVAFWYQTEAHQRVFFLPPLNERLPNSFWKIQKLDRKSDELVVRPVVSQN